MDIAKLPENVQSLIRTGIAISSISQCTVELVMNSLDAGASNVGVRIDLSKYQIQVVDDGCGLNKEQLNLIGSRYMTSKCSSLFDLEENLKYYGYRGEALASIKEASDTVLIFSKPKGEDCTYTKVMKRSEKNSTANKAKLDRPKNGTTVVVMNVLCNLPVRQKRLHHVLEIEQIKNDLQMFALIHPQVSFSLRNDVTKSVIMHTKPCTDIIQNFHQVFEIDTVKDFMYVTENENKFIISGYISREIVKTKKFQFVYVNKRYVYNKELYRYINLQLKKSFYLKTINSKENKSNKNNSNKKLFIDFDSNEIKDDHAVFIISIECPWKEYDICFEPKKQIIEFKNWGYLFNLISNCIGKFLELENNLHNLNSNDIPVNTDFELLKQTSLNIEADKIVQEKINSNKENKQICSENHKNSRVNKKFNFVTPITKKICGKKRNYENHNEFSSGKRSLAHSEHLLTECEDFTTRKIPRILNSNEHNKRSIIPNICKDIYENNLQLLKNNIDFLNSTMNKPLIKYVTMMNTLQNGKSLVSIKEIRKKKSCNKIQKLKDSMINTQNHKQVKKVHFDKNTLENFKKSDKSQSDVSHGNKCSVKDFINKISTKFKTNTYKKKQIPETKILHELEDKSINPTCGVHKKAKICSNEPSTQCNEILNKTTLMQEHLNYSNKKQLFNDCTSLESKNSRDVKSCIKNAKKRYFVKHTSTQTCTSDINSTESFMKNMNENKSRHFMNQENRSNCFNKVLEHNVNEVIQNVSSFTESNNEILKDNFDFVNLKTYQEYRSLEQSNGSFKLNFDHIQNSDLHCKIVNHLINYEGNSNIDNDFENCNYKKIAQECNNNSFKPSVEENEPRILMCVDDLNENYNANDNGFNQSDHILNLIKLFENLKIDENYVSNYYESDMEVSQILESSQNSYQNLTPDYLHDGSPVESELIQCDDNNNEISSTGIVSPVKEFISECSNSNSKDFDPFKLNLKFAVSKEHSRKNCVFSIGNDKINKLIMNTNNDCGSEICCSSKEKNSNASDPVEQIPNNSNHTFTSVFKDNCDRNQKNDNVDYTSELNFENCDDENIVNDDKRCGSDLIFDNSNSLTNQPELTNDNSSVTNWRLHKLQTGQEIYIHMQSGMSSYSTPIESSDKCNITERLWFLPKGISPLQDNSIKNINKQDASFSNRLTDSHKKELLNVIQENDKDFQDNSLSDVKWENIKKPGYDDVLSALKPGANTDQLKLVKSSLPLMGAYSFSKEDLSNTEVIGLLDKKFIIAKMVCAKKNLIVVFDQHAVDERIRYENLCKGYKNNNDTFCTVPVNPPLVLHITATNKLEIIENFIHKFNEIGLQLVININDATVMVNAVPTCLFNRAGKENASNVNTKLLELINMLLDEEIDYIVSTNGAGLQMPHTINSVICYEACRGAVKFGDTITKATAQIMLKQLSLCMMPFQCAHGRPVLAPIFDLGD